MRVCVIAVLLCSLAVAMGETLPPGYESASDLANVLANEPAAARFAETRAADTISFGASPAVVTSPTTTVTTSSSGGCGCASEQPVPSGCDCAYDGVDDDTSEFDAQLEQIAKDIENLKKAIKETEECAKRLREQQAELRAMKEQKDHLEKEKEKKILQGKLERQMRDLAEINRMSRSLRGKFNELKHTQKLIKTKMVGTRSSLNNLDSEPEIDTESLADGADMLGKQMDAMHKSQMAMLASVHARNEAHVQHEINTANRVHGDVLKEEAAE